MYCKEEKEGGASSQNQHGFRGCFIHTKHRACLDRLSTYLFI